MANREQNNLLRAYPLNNQYISSINYQSPQNEPQSTTKPEFIIVLDRSGSMRDSVRRIVNEILPIMFTKLCYDQSDKIHLITFSDDDDYNFLPINQLTSMTNFDQGGTCMFPAIRRLVEVFQNFQRNSIDTLRVLAVSDGLISDQDKTEASAGELTRFVKSFPISINSQAIRWEQPSADTRALCSLLQLNNVKPAQMLDTKLITSNEDIAESWAKLFRNDQLTTGTILSSKEKIFLKNPWDEEATEKIRLQNGSNTVWMTQMPNDPKINDVSVNVNEDEHLNYETLYELMKEKYNYVVNQMKVHKVVSTRESVYIMHRIVTYFKKVEIEVPVPDGTKRFSTLLEDIANDKNVAHMSPEELKAYLEPKDVKKEFKPNMSGKNECEKRDEELKVMTMSPEQLVDVLKSFGFDSVMILLLKNSKRGKNDFCQNQCKFSKIF